MDSGLKIDYLDYHMLTPVSTPEYRAIVEKLAAEYNLGLSGYFGETFDMLFHVPIAGKKDTLLAALGSLQPDKVNVMVMHIGYENAEMNALLDMNSALMRGAANESLVGKHRHAELQALCAPEFREQIEKKKIKLVTYREIMSGRGLKAMKAPQ